MSKRRPQRARNVSHKVQVGLVADSSGRSESDHQTGSGQVNKHETESD